MKAKFLRKSAGAIDHRMIFSSAAGGEIPGIKRHRPGR
jgi:hypothetical protein